ncbi:NAD(P)/FAD-dependent oxidoreductase [Nocardia iowensis]|uniref:FAD-binding oxidoreductase n=1 Tax=Nocardia iowensis TaxID=204891 RepID=A0ABX8RGP8_NOCIO|nr:FAD-binding oxidoreductase [Nocardia iowensis]QXN88773.1 FAD-binding oxidoreductase [Nocardia iowensis]
MSDHADVVVIGGGILGCTLALHLIESGAGSVRLLERDGLFQGTSAAGAGFLASWTPFAAEQAVAGYSLDYYARLQAEGHDIDLRSNGILSLDARASSLQEISDSGAEYGEQATVVDAAEVEALTHGLVAGSGIAGGLFEPGGAQVFAPKVGAALAERLHRHPGVVDSRRPVTALRTRGGRIVGVETATGTIDCAAVVVAAGAWSNELLAPLGIFLPTAPQITSRIITENLDLPSTLPALFLSGLIPEDTDGGTLLWVRWHAGGLLWGGTYDTYPRNILLDAPMPERLDEIPYDGVRELLRVAARADTVMPVLARQSSITVKHGAPCYTPDWRALVGPVAAVEGLYALTGDNEAGLTHGPGYAKVLTDLLLHGTSDLTSAADWSPNRFNDRYTTQTAVIEAFLDYETSFSTSSS